MLAPGGLTYYAAVWCNDNVEYAGPFFPSLGDAHGNQTSLDTYRLYQPFMKPDYKRIPSSIIAEGVDTWAGAGDRGDSAMYAYGCSRFCLVRGDKAIAEELWPAIAWCLEYGRRQNIVENRRDAYCSGTFPVRLPDRNLTAAADRFWARKLPAETGKKTTSKKKTETAPQ